MDFRFDGDVSINYNNPDESEAQLYIMKDGHMKTDNEKAVMIYDQIANANNITGA